MRTIENLNPILKTKSNRINYALNSQLVQEIENWLKSCWSVNYYPATSLGEFVKKSLEAYKQGVITLNFKQRPVNESKRDITIR